MASLLVLLVDAKHPVEASPALSFLVSHRAGDSLPANFPLLVHRTKPTHTVVNCWFCNQDTVVPYGNRNCWDCPHCEQYNGFQEVRQGSDREATPCPFPVPIPHHSPASFL